MTAATELHMVKRRRTYSESVRRKAVALHDRGYGAKRIGSILGIDYTVVREWLRRYELFGEEALRPGWRKPTERSGSDCDAVAKPVTVEKYRRAVELYATTHLKGVEICRECAVSCAGFYAYMRKYHRDMVLLRNGIELRECDAKRVRLRTKYGQTSAAWGKYGPAIEACADPAYYSDNISQIAARFGLKGTHLANQLRVHYSELLRRREAERQRLGLSDNQQRGVRPYCAEKYAEAVELFRTTLLTRREIPERLGISLGGFAQHLLYYHKDLIAERRALREAAKYTRKPGTLTGCGTIRKASPTAEAKYGKAVELYRTTALSVKRIAEQEHVSLSGLTHHIGTWHRDAILERRGAKRASSDTDYIDLSRTKHYLRSTAEKYGKAIEKLKNGDYTTAQVAAEYGLHPECMRAYLKEHEPELYARQGMTHLANGRTVSRRSMEKYAEAIRLYETTDESLKSIARRLNLTYNSLDGYVRRNHSDLIEHRKNTVDNNRK